MAAGPIACHGWLHPAIINHFPPPHPPTHPTRRSEMDYSWEANAMNTFSQQMKPLKGVMVTEAVPGMCSDEVLTTYWCVRTQGLL